MTRDAAALRALVVAAVRQNPLTLPDDPSLLDRLDDPAVDASFDAFGFDSLARMEMCIWMQLEAAIELRESDLIDHPTIAALTAHLVMLG
ncbi:acyl carrier protein [Roseomonas sp. CAU 1739]|uniref:acyl carrier protein n=1 Tax=Roseomonas sp. CAU 1739 TaxID=3140364 RepID=UPI00325B10A5